ncbi:MAG TPA: biopolymer transporter ExbD [Kiritimatiellia bacterium]|jgi:biopolymer transport protein ExbD|nr:biopolymer transporter ExbD [Kiritimatiellia bacterium]
MAKEYEQCEIDMTPMIDVVFQLIIFFVVTMKMNQEFNQDIVLEDGKHGVTITAENMPPTTLEIELDRRGRVSIHNATLTEKNLRDILRARVNKHGNEFPVLIRADRRTLHDKVRKLMDVCTSCGVWKLSFVAVQEHKARDDR